MGGLWTRKEEKKQAGGGRQADGPGQPAAARRRFRGNAGPDTGKDTLIETGAGAGVAVG
jgi:hypothetical protein